MKAKCKVKDVFGEAAANSYPLKEMTQQEIHDLVFEVPDKYWDLKGELERLVWSADLR